MNTVSRVSHRFVGFFPAQIRRGVVQLSARIYLGRARSTLTRGGSVSRFVRLLPREGTRDAPRLLSHSTRPWLPQSPAAGLSKRGRCCSAPSFAGTPQLRLCVAARLAGSRGHAAPDRLESQAWPSNLALRAQVPYAIQNFVDQLGGCRAASSVWSGHIRPRGSPTPSVKAAIAFKDVIAVLPFFRPACMTA